MAIPQDLKYTEEHEWIRVTGDIATVGITDYAQDQLGDVVYVDLPSSGTSLTQFGKLGEIDALEIHWAVGGGPRDSEVERQDRGKCSTSSLRVG